MTGQRKPFSIRSANIWQISWPWPIHAREADSLHAGLYTNDGKPLTSEPKIDAITYSGGVASCYYNGEPANVFEYGDVGVLLARAVKNNAALKQVLTYPAAETIRATVVGAGTHTTNVSGSTISYSDGQLPIKNIPVLKLTEDEEQNPVMFKESLRRKLKLYEIGRCAEPGCHCFFRQISYQFSGDSGTGTDGCRWGGRGNCRTTTPHPGHRK